MPLRILLVAATSAEADAMRKICIADDFQGGYSFGNNQIDILITGVGSVAVSWAMTKWLSSNSRPDLAMNAGIAGSFRDDFKIGDVLIPVWDCFADAGIETGSGFLTLAEAGLDDPDRFPFTEGKIVADNKFIRLALKRLRPAKAITVNTASGSESTIDRILGKYDPDIETMEGAAFFYICSREGIPFIAMRSISNRIGPRDKEKWDIPLAIERLSEKLGEFLTMLD
jgi:futalosine hydrolase